MAPAFSSFLVVYLVGSLLAGYAMLFLLLTYRPITRRIMQGFVALLTVITLALDFQQRTVLYPSTWPLVVILTDVALLLRLGTRFATVMMSAVSLWIVCMLSENVFRFGLYDVPGNLPQWYRTELHEKMCSCSNPPCAVPIFMGGMDGTVSLCVLLIDFIATHNFAASAEREQASMARTIATVEEIAQHLAGYDIDTVSEMLQGADAQGLPPAMHVALQTLEEHLRTYRPYLPEALFTEDPGEYPDTQFHHRSAPGAVDGDATIVFTDVRSSTSIWEMVPEAMKKAMQVHNSVIREDIAALEGYEVKTIGDSFMVAFQEAPSAVDFGLRVQQSLFNAAWPAALLDFPICRRSDLWVGLTVRVGVSRGPVTLETNILTGRVDYFGHTVNVAARLEGACSPGAVAVPADVWAEVGSRTCLPAVSGPQVTVRLKGVGGAVAMREVWPVSLGGRRTQPLVVMSGEFLPPSVPDPGLNMSLSNRSKDTLSGSIRSRRLSPAHSFRNGKTAEGTIGTITLCRAGDTPPWRDINFALEAMLPWLQQSRGTLVTLFGEYLFVGWTPLHQAENAVQFAQRVIRAPWASCATLGLASGMVHHGDVGTNTQRFVTLAGETACASVRVWYLAQEERLPCLYRAGERKLSGALRGMLCASAVVSPAGLGVLSEIVSL